MAAWFSSPSSRAWCAPSGRAGVRDFHRSLPGYAVTPLVDLPPLAEELGVGRVLVKDESARLGLPAFKVLDASWACHRVLQAQPGARLVTATDGNHGRAVARTAVQLGVPATVFLPDVTLPETAAAIAAEGAEVVQPEAGAVVPQRHQRLSSISPATIRPRLPRRSTCRQSPTGARSWSPGLSVDSHSLGGHGSPNETACVPRRGTLMRHGIRWTEEAEAHIARHGVLPAEVEEAAYTRPRLVAAGREDTRLVLGTTSAGRHLFVVLAESLDGVDYCVTAREMTDKERRLFRRRAGKE